MNSNLIDQEQQNFKNNIKQEPEVEFLCILPSYDSGTGQREELVQVKQEKEIQSEKISKHQCKTCQKIFGSACDLRRHEKTHQNEQCKVCNRKVRPQRFKKHMKSHQNEKTERKFECKICFLKFITNLQLYNHVPTHSKRIQCDLCGHYSATSKHKLTKHLTLHFVQGQFKCIFCRKLFDDRESFRLHSRQVHGDPKNRKGLTKADLSCKTCGKEFDDVKARKSHEKTHGEKVQCPICDKKYKPSTLAQHLKLHKLKEKGRIFMCDICGYKNASKSILNDHLEVHFSPVKGKCQICWKIFTNTKSLQNHSRTIHNLNVEPSKLCCNICQVKCANLSALTIHKSTHKAPKTCPICSKSIKPISFSSHMKLHKLNKEEMKVECRDCGMKFYAKSDLNQHMKTHKKCLECDLCEYRTGRKEHMNHHMANHMEHKPLKCEICHRGFSSRPNLKRHRSTHFHPHRCNLCPASFNLEKMLNRHIKSHHKIEQLSR